MDAWYVVHTRPNDEVRATVHLARQGFETFLPKFAKKRRHARRVERVLSPLFPRYLFVHLDLGADRWRAVNSTIGVSHLICDADMPIAVRPGIVEGLIDQADKSGRVEPAALQILRPGDRLVVVDGAMCDHVGEFERMTADQRVVLLLNVLGREVRVTLPLGAVDAA